MARLPRCVLCGLAGLVVACALGPLPARSEASGSNVTPDHYTNIGLTMGWTWGSALGGPTLGVDATAGDGIGWLSLGSRIVMTEEGVVGLPYVEAGGWFVVTLGVGWTWVFGLPDRRAGPHLFVGTPLPTGIVPRRSRPLPCNELAGGVFYRPFWTRSATPGQATQVLHEASASVKCYAERVWGPSSRD